MDFVKKHWQWILSAYIAFVFLQSLAFKGAELVGEPADITVYIFSTVGQWISSIGFGSVGELFSQYGGIVIGVAELIASVLILIPRARVFGALLALGTMSGAIFFHVFTPLGLYPYIDLECVQAGCDREYALFYMAVGVWISAAVLAWKNRFQVLPSQS